MLIFSLIICHYISRWNTFYCKKVIWLSMESNNDLTVKVSKTIILFITFLCLFLYVNFKAWIYEKIFEKYIHKCVQLYTWKWL